MTDSMERPNWTWRLSASKKLMFFTHIASDIKVWITEGLQVMIDIETKYAQDSAALLENKDLALVDPKPFDSTKGQGSIILVEDKIAVAVNLKPFDSTKAQDSMILVEDKIAVLFNLKPFDSTKALDSMMFPLSENSLLVLDNPLPSETVMCLMDTRASPLTIFPSNSRSEENESGSKRKMAEGWVRATHADFHSVTFEHTTKHFAAELHIAPDCVAQNMPLKNHSKPPLKATKHVSTVLPKIAFKPVSKLPSQLPSQLPFMSAAKSAAAAKMAMNDEEEEGDVTPGHERGVHHDDVNHTYKNDDVDSTSSYNTSNDEHWHGKTHIGNETCNVHPGSPGHGLGKGCVMKNSLSTKKFIANGKPVSGSKGKFCKTATEMAKEVQACLHREQRLAVLVKQIRSLSTFVNHDGYVKPSPAS